MDEITAEHITPSSESGQIADSLAMEPMVFKPEPIVLEPWEPNYQEGLLISHSLADSKPLPFVKKEAELGSGMFYMYVVILVIWSFMFRRDRKTLVQINTSVFNNNALNQLLDGRGGLNSLLSVVLFLIGLFLVSVFGYQLLDVHSVSLLGSEILPTWSAILIFFLGVVVLFFLKTVVILLSSWIFRAPAEFNTYLSANVVSIQFVGFVLFPLSVLATYGVVFNPKWVLNIGVILVLMAFVFRLWRLFFLAVKQTNSQLFHIILYICALEILPLLVVSRWIIDLETF